MNIIAGRNEADDGTWDIPFNPIPDFAASCQTTDLKGFRIGVPRNTFLKVEPSVLVAFETALQTLGEAGAQIVENSDLESVDEFKKLDKETKSFCMTAEFKSDLSKYFSGLQNNPHNLRTVEDLIEFTKQSPEEEYPERDIDIFLRAQADGTDISSAKYEALREKELNFGGAGGILGTLEKFNLDVLAVPSTIEIPTSLAAKMGFPIISVPLGFYPEDTKIKMNKRGDLVQVAPGIPYVS
jgi:amidase